MKTYRTFSFGNVVNWNTANWQLENMVRDNKSQEEVCLLPEQRDIVFPELRSYHDTKLLCKKVGGKMTVVTNDDMQKNLVEIFKKTLAEKYYDMGKVMNDSCYVPTAGWAK